MIRLCALTVAASATFAAQSFGATPSGTQGGEANSAAAPANSRAIRQETLHNILNPLLMQAAEAGSTGFAGVEGNADLSAATLHWKGDPPAWLTDRLKASAGALPIQVDSVAVSEADLPTISNAVRDAWDDSWGEFQGLSVSPGWNSISVQRYLTRSAVDISDVQVRNLLAARIRDLPAIVTVQSSRISNFARGAWRGNDSTPWNGGGRMRTATNYCTTGPGLILASGARRLLSAGHCNRLPPGTGGGVVDGAEDAIGPITLNIAYADPPSQGDLMLIQANPFNRVFIGSWENSAGPYRQTTGWGFNAAGDQVCNEGSMSGEHCYLTVTSTVTDPQFGTPLTRAVHTSPTGIAMAEGDSGAAVVARDGSSGAEIRGVAIALAGNTSPCSGGSGNPCWQDSQYASAVLYISAKWILDRFPGSQFVF